MDGMGRKLEMGSWFEQSGLEALRSCIREENLIYKMHNMDCLVLFWFPTDIHDKEHLYAPGTPGRI